MDEMYSPEWCEEQKHALTKAIAEILKGQAKIYVPQDEPDHTRRRLFEIGIEMAVAACDFERCSFMEMTTYLGAMENVYALCGGKDYSTKPTIALYKAGTELGWRVEIDGQLFSHIKEIPDFLMARA